MSQPESSPDLARLLRWQDAGGAWLVIGRRRGWVEVSLLRCDGGEEADRFATQAPDLLAYVNARG